MGTKVLIFEVLRPETTKNIRAHGALLQKPEKTNV